MLTQPLDTKRVAAAKAEFKRMLVIICIAGVFMVIGALWYLSLYGPLQTHMVIATIGGVFVSMVLGCGLFAAAFFSDKSGYDDGATGAPGKTSD
ncbi:MAG TPA: hypothetical protein VNQ31_03780 [Sphingomonadaceae bacterium]|nr:hypothetical protein [Sphingomonadaceae bacterium]